MVQKIKKTYLYNLRFCIFLYLAAIGALLPVFAESKQPETIKQILFLNSYHQGYAWSDDILQGIKNGLSSSNELYELQIEYMDTQRVTDSRYIDQLKELYRYKFNQVHFDCIISSDDAAFNFLLEEKESLFPDTPVVFCGVNYLDSSLLAERSNFTGIVEGYDIRSTLELALQLHPQTEHLYYINDDTLTGQAIMKEFLRIAPEFSQKLTLERLDGRSLTEIEQKAAELPSNSIILLLIYFQDRENNHFVYHEIATRLSKAGTTPIYGVWDFHLGYGIVGGKLTSGYFQGETAAQYALRILAGETPGNIPIVTENTTVCKFDATQLNRFGIPFEKLPRNSTIINLKTSSKKQVLILNSYNKGLKWTDDIEKGIHSALSGQADSIEFIYEYIDSKRHQSPEYLQETYDYLLVKYQKETFDAIITTDDDAFNFIAKFCDKIFPETPVFFCGVNYLNESMLPAGCQITGVVEAYDIEANIDLALKLMPETHTILVINDTTATGLSNKKNLESIIPKYKDIVSFEIWEDVNFTDIQKNLLERTQGEIILLLSFNRDKSYNTFTYDESISNIAAFAKIPIFGLWDFYLDHGLIGGLLISGFNQGEIVGTMAANYFSGTPFDQIPIITTSPNTYMFDKTVLDTFDIHESELPPDAIIINKPEPLSTFIRENTILLLTILSLLIISALLFLNMKLIKASERKEKIFALTDPMTGIPNRRAGLEHIKKCFAQAQNSKTPLTICFADVNNLKKINDTLGHREGDELIKAISNILVENVRSNDLVSRIGGDEFLLTFMGANLEQAEEIWKRIQLQLEHVNEKHMYAFTMSLCAGFAEYHKTSHSSIFHLIEEADAQMYKNKANYKKSL